MTEYISKEAMLKNLTADLEHHSGEGDSRTHLVMQRFIKYVEDFPAADDTNVGHKSGDWISCKDRMPEVNEPVLFIFNTESGFKAVMYGWHETIKGLGSGWHQAGVGGARADEEVTYWQPLPEPPKDGEQNDKG